MKIALAQINPTIGAFDLNIRKMRQYIDRAKEAGIHLVVFPEMSITGYPPRDLLDRPGFVADNLKALDEIKSYVTDMAAIVGFVDVNTVKKGKHLYNAAAFIKDGHIRSKQYKSLLPSYDVFDERRYFEPAQTIELLDYRRLKFGISICEDIWTPEDVLPRPIYHADPVDDMIKLGAQFIVNISASPFNEGKINVRRNLVANQAKKYNMPFLYVNQVGGNDDLVFDGNSIVCEANGSIVALGADFEEDMVTVEIKNDKCFPLGKSVTTVNRYENSNIENIYKALTLGVKDYAGKCGFKKAIIGLSGGIDSAVVAAVAANALGKGNVVGVAMSSKYSSEESVTDARDLAENLGIEFKEMPIVKIHEVYTKMFKKEFKGLPENEAEENLQARMRGNIIMALSNKFGYLVLATGNKSELSVGYCTLYGDMCGGLAVISDVPKMMVYDLAKHINAEKEIIPLNTIEKPPSAELRPDQKDQDSLPPYLVLDGILKAHIEEAKTLDEIVEMGYEREMARCIIKMVDKNEYKRKQAAPGLRVTSKAFGAGRRMPTAQLYSEL